MSASIWLIAEDSTDVAIFKQILKSRGITTVVREVAPSGGSGGISRLAQQLLKLIRTIRVEKHYYRSDCIVVLHDKDADTPGRNTAEYDTIDAICRNEDILHLVADDKIEAWLLADKGICDFFGIHPASWDGKTEAKDRIEALLHARKISYHGRPRQQLIERLTGTGDQFSRSLKSALKQLADANCIESYA